METSTTMLGASAAMRAVEREISVAAGCGAKVLITGRKRGREGAGGAAHPRARSTQHPHPFVPINCAGLPDTLLESELFGHVRGSFTGAYRDKRGRLEAAHKGTIFMDEVGEMSLRMQAMLLRFLETRRDPAGRGRPRDAAPLDVRVIAATHRDLVARVADQSFREDLFYRLNVVHIEVPPLRDRTGRHLVPAALFPRRLLEPPSPADTRNHARGIAAPADVRLAGECSRTQERRRAHGRGRRVNGRVDVGSLPPEIGQERRHAPADAAIQLSPWVNSDSIA